MREKGSTEEREVHFKELAMVAGGSCITPPFQVLNAILKDPNDRTEIWLLFANQTPKDVLMKYVIKISFSSHNTTRNKYSLFLGTI